VTELLRRVIAGKIPERSDLTLRQHAPSAPRRDPGHKSTALGSGHQTVSRPKGGTCPAHGGSRRRPRLIVPSGRGRAAADSGGASGGALANGAGEGGGAEADGGEGWRTAGAERRRKDGGGPAWGPGRRNPAATVGATAIRPLPAAISVPVADPTALPAAVGATAATPPLYAAANATVANRPLSYRSQRDCRDPAALRRSQRDCRKPTALLPRSARLPRSRRFTPQPTRLPRSDRSPTAVSVTAAIPPPSLRLRSGRFSSPLRSAPIRPFPLPAPLVLRLLLRLLLRFPRYCSRWAGRRGVPVWREPPPSRVAASSAAEAPSPARMYSTSSSWLRALAGRASQPARTPVISSAP
jgi:hypothetical protein